MSAAAWAGFRRWRGQSRLPLPLLWLMAGALLALLPSAPASLAVPADGMDVPQPTRVERFNPDQQVCLPQAIRTAFASHLKPFADQPPAVLAQLRLVQAEMTRATLQRCVSKGLLQAAEASQLERDLGLQQVSGSAAVSAPSASGAAPAARP